VASRGVEKELTKLALGVGNQYAAQGLVSNTESVSALLFATARQVAADQKLLEPSPDLRDRRRAFLGELRVVIADMERIFQLSRQQFYARETALPRTGEQRA
jgi:glycerol-3-phosphate O-acyltransferase